MNMKGWSLIREIGIERARSSDSTGVSLYYPVVAEQLDEGTYLIVDEVGVNRGIPFRMQCRTLLVDKAQNILFDTQSLGIEDGHGCLIDNNRIAVLRRTHWDILLCSRDGAIAKRVDLSNVSKYLPRTIWFTYRKTFLIVFLNRSTELDIAEIDQNGELLRYLSGRESQLGVPGSVQLLDDGRIVVADAFLHVISECGTDGSRRTLWGELRCPAPDPNHLSAPHSAQVLGNGGLLIADTHNHRVLLVESDGTPKVLAGGGDLSSPTFARQLPNGHILLCDGGNGRVIELDRTYRQVWQYGRSPNERRCFSFPRSVEIDRHGNYLIADTANNRVVRVQRDEIETLPFRGSTPLFWPRAATRSGNGSVLVADGRNSRVLEISNEGEVRHELCALESGLTFSDPHDIVAVSNGRFLVVDPGAGFVVETDWMGKIYRLIGAESQLELDDPHNAQLLPNGDILISDSGHHRSVRVDEHGRVVEEMSEFRNGVSRYRFNRPRYVGMSPDGVMIVVDTGNNRILAADASGKLLWNFHSLPESPIPVLLHPRWAYLIGHDELLVTDHFHHRILHLKRDPT